MKGLLLAAAMAVASTAAAQDVDSILKTAERAYHEITTLRADFDQIIDNPMFGAPESSSGVLFLSPPDRFAMRFNDPAGDRIVADGRWLWLFTPSSIPDQVIRQPIPTSGPASPNLFSQFVDRPLDRYTARYVAPDTIGGVPVDKIRLVPRVEGIPFRQVVIAISRRDGMLKHVDLVEDAGQRRTLTFLRIEVNAPIAAQELMFRPPKNVRVVTGER